MHCGNEDGAISLQHCHLKAAHTSTGNHGVCTENQSEIAFSSIISSSWKPTMTPLSHTIHTQLLIIAQSDFTRDFVAQTYFFLKTSSFAITSHGLEAFLPLIFQKKHPVSRARPRLGPQPKHTEPACVSPSALHSIISPTQFVLLSRTTPRGQSSPRPLGLLQISVQKSLAEALFEGTDFPLQVFS